jgi:hydrogenase maturation factor HypF (carbamoyltransferase family)
VKGEAEFVIAARQSDARPLHPLISPDVATCDDCLRSSSILLTGDICNPSRTATQLRASVHHSSKTIHYDRIPPTTMARFRMCADSRQGRIRGSDGPPVSRSACGCPA